MFYNTLKAHDSLTNLTIKTECIFYIFSLQKKSFRPKCKLLLVFVYIFLKVSQRQLQTPKRVKIIS